MIRLRTLSVLALGLVSAAALHLPQDRTNRTTVTQQIVYLFEETTYEEPIRIEDGLEHPDPYVVAASRHLRAMQSGDVDAWLRTWDPGGKTFYTHRLERPWGVYPKRSEQDLQKLWSELATSEVLIIAKATAPTFTTIAFEARKPGAKAKPGLPGFNGMFDDDGVVRDRLPFMVDPGFASSDGPPPVEHIQRTGLFANHPVVSAWRTGGNGIQTGALDQHWQPTQAWPPEKN